MDVVQSGWCDNPSLITATFIVLFVKKRKREKKTTTWFCTVLPCYVCSPPSSHLHLSMRVGRGQFNAYFCRWTVWLVLGLCVLC